ncbi:hypothetical protein HYH03_017588 [Edaphochlamys debaryana]|uniref:NOT2/NOT3/NOT5 C-terminal domain-containing protein n=1 Tax=Edaphochlamys debaryana TaxID=47281 RepID=A0A836BP65_9CHLO|nr:hypothetical protein HYH03_017588 [Edaphochlamys debaryana]|eukprot:KAG2483582.1 hypothetical protein HYH03_017588 [Edaphochlamys debaryana]
MLNPGGLDPSGARGFAQYGQQGQTAGFPLGALQGGMQGGLPGVRTGIAGLQAGAGGPQQTAQNRFSAANTLQSNLQQLGQYAQAQGRPLTNAQLANGVLAGAAGAGVRAQGIGGLGPLAAMRQPGVDRTAANLSLAANLNAAAAGAAGAGLAGLQGYGAQNPLAAALQNPQRLTGLGLNAQLTAAAAAGLGGLQGTNLQNRLQMANAGAAGLGLLQQGLAGALPNPNPNTHELLAMLNRQKQQQQQQQQHQQQGMPGAANAFNALSNLGLGGNFGAGGGGVGGLGGPVGGLQGGLQQSQQSAAAQQAAAAAAAQQQQHGVGGDPDGPSFDNTDFPSLLANAAARQGRGDVMGPNDPFAKLGLRTAAAAVAAGGGHGANAGGGGDFQIQNEDFPALPGSSQRDGLGPGGGAGGMAAAAAAAAAAQQQAAGRGGPGTGFGAEHLQQMAGQPGSAEYEAFLRLQQQQRGGMAPGLLGPGPAGLAGKVGMGGDMGGGGQGGPGAAAAAAAQAKADRFGLMGLLPLIKMSDPDLTMLALGTDLTGLGLNLNATGDLHSTLVSPLADTPIKAEPDFDLPSCYKFVPQRLQPGYLSKFKEETLFYMFYSMPGDEAQLLAADELSVRGWWFHRRYKLWMLHAPNTAVQKSQRGERGSYLIFDINQWEIVQKADLEILYEDIEGAPRLPRNAKLQQQPQSGQGQVALPPQGQPPPGAVQGRH